MRVHPVPDVFLHIAIANELTHTVPPQCPVFSGHPLTYHYGMDLVVAMFANATGLNTRDLTLRFVPTLFLALSMLSVFCFSRGWLGSGYFAALVVFLVFFGEDFAFIPGLLLGEKGDWSVRYFSVPTVFSLFYTNPMLPGVGLLFAGLFCLQRYLRERGGAWLFLSALLLVALMEVKVFTAAQIMCSLGFAAVVYLLLFRNADLVQSRGFDCRSGGATGSVSSSGKQKWRRHYHDVRPVALCLPHDGCAWDEEPVERRACFYRNRLADLSRRLPWPARDWCARDPQSDISSEPEIWFALCSSVFRGARTANHTDVPHRARRTGHLHTTTASGFSPRANTSHGSSRLKFFKPYIGISLREACGPRRSQRVITPSAIALSVPATAQHFALERDPSRLYGKPLGKELQSYSLETLSVIDFLAKDAQLGDVVLPDENLLAPTLALTKCRVPLGYFSIYMVAQSDYRKGTRQRKNFGRPGGWDMSAVTFYERWSSLRRRQQAIQRYPSKNPRSPLRKVFENSEFAVFEVQGETLSETTPEPITSLLTR